MLDVKAIALEYLMQNLGVPKFYFNQVKFDCPKCDHGSKKNLEINYVGAFNCWSCGYRGFINKLLREYASNDSWQQISALKNIQFSNTKAQENKIELPKSIIPFYLNKDVESYLVKERGIDKELLIERNVGYVYSDEDDLYNNIIFPFYDVTGTKVAGYSVHNFATKRYKNFGKRNFIPYIQFIDTNYPVGITEGIYDAFSMPNVIPLLGKTIWKELLHFITGKHVILALDKLGQEVTTKELDIIIDQIIKSSVRSIYYFSTESYKDLNEFRTENKPRLIEKYKNAIESIFEEKFI